MTYKKTLINSIEPNFIFSKKPLNRLTLKELSIGNRNLLKIDQLNALKEKINSIQNCNLKKNSSSIVMGDGNIDSPIMIIGEAPGFEEEKVCKTFQGESGLLLERMLLAINLRREKTYSSYAVNFRPPDDRKPTTKEIKRYSNFLKEHISIINPQIIILFGSTAMESMISANKKISDERGKWKEIIIKKKTYQLIITFSPSYLIRFPENKKYSWEDLKNIRQKIKNLKLSI